MKISEIIDGLKKELRIIGEVKNELCIEKDPRYATLKHSLCQCFVLLDYLEEEEN